MFHLFMCLLFISCSESETKITEVADVDGDGFNAGEDCDDNDPDRSPGAQEVCDGVDNDCDGFADEDVELVFYADADQDGHGSLWMFVEACEAPPGFVSDSSDCDDTEAMAFPGFPEICDGIDNDCDAAIDEDVRISFYFDGDGDGHGVPEIVIEACEQPAGFVLLSDDCDDIDSAVYPGAPEDCDGADNNCDGVIDDGLELSSFYFDADQDGYASEDSVLTEACSAPPGHTQTLGDCDDSDAQVNPTAVEVCDDVLDNNCDGLTDCEDFSGCKQIEPICWVCGDNVVDGDESCDDGNTIDGDGCDSVCQNEETYLDGICGYSTNGQFCSGNCTSNTAEYADAYCQVAGFNGAVSYVEHTSGMFNDIVYYQDSHTGLPDDCADVLYSGSYGLASYCTCLTDLYCY